MLKLNAILKEENVRFSLEKINLKFLVGYRIIKLTGWCIIFITTYMIEVGSN